METIKDIVLQDQKDAKADEHDSYLQEVIEHGCISGIVNGLIYYNDTIQFYLDHKEEINQLLAEAMDSTCCSPYELFSDKWDSEDPLVMDTNNQNLLAWFAYEETARAVLQEQGVEV